MTTPITGTTNYSYQLSAFTAQACSGCAQGFYWGNQKDGDYLDYYNGKFTGFAQALVSKPDGGVEIHHYNSSTGWGVYDCAQVSCSGPGSYCVSQCHNDAWWQVGNAAHGREFEGDYYATDGVTLLRQRKTQYSLTCPPSGVGGTPATTYGNWDGNLVSELDPSNPVASCDVQVARTDDIAVDGSSGTAQPDAATTYTYDSYGRVTNQTVTANDGAATGSATTVVHKPAYIWSDAVGENPTVVNGRYLIAFQAFTDDEDASGNRTRCIYTSYDGQSYATGSSSALMMGEATRTEQYTNCGTAANGFNDRSGPITTTQGYDIYGNAQTTDDPDANAGDTRHVGCSIVGQTFYSSCDIFDGTFAVLPIMHSNALAQSSTTTYQSPTSATASFGFGLWPVTSTDGNNQTTSYSYDGLGRPTTTVLPGDSSANPTIAYAYTTWCSGSAAQAPCTEVDQTQRLNATTTVTDRAFYDGWGHLVETRVPAPNNQDVVRFSFFDKSNRQAFQSISYFVGAYTGGPGSSAYSIPDTSQPGTSYTYDGLGRVTSTKDALSNLTSNSITVACNAAGTGDSACYEQTLSVDPLGHQAGQLVDALGRIQYAQRYTGNLPASYALYATAKYTYDVSGNLTRILHPDGATSTSFVYDMAKRQIGLTDPDLGTSSYTYDPDGNLTQSVDARGASGTVYAGYDGLNRQLWRNTTNSPTNAYATSSYDSTAAGNLGIGRLTAETFSGGPGNSLSGGYTYTYDARGQQIAATLSVAANTYPVQTTFDDAGNVLTQTYPTGEVVTTGYTPQGWLSSLSTSQGNTTLMSGATYTGFGGAVQQITAASLGGGAYQYNATYDALLRATDLKWTNGSGSTTFFDQTRTFDGAGNVTSANSTLPAGTDNQVFCYDEQNRLTWAGSTGTPPCTGNAIASGTIGAYKDIRTYDNLGRITSLQTTLAGNMPYVYGDPAHVHAVTQIGSQHCGLFGCVGGAIYSASYDLAGDMTCRNAQGAGCSGAGALLSYDAERRLSSWQNTPSNPASSASFLYDNQGNRVEQIATLNGTTTTTVYVGGLEQVASSGASTTTTTYDYAGSLRLAMAVNGSFYYLASDGLGSADLAIKAADSSTSAVLYAPYGTARYSNGTMPTDYGFTGQHSDATSGLDYYNARYYDPIAGQFINADRLLADSYDLLGLSRYAYVEGNPISRTDPTGHRYDLGCEPDCPSSAAPVPVMPGHDSSQAPTTNSVNIAQEPGLGYQGPIVATTGTSGPTAFTDQLPYSIDAYDSGSSTFSTPAYGEDTPRIVTPVSEGGVLIEAVPVADPTVTLLITPTGQPGINVLITPVAEAGIRILHAEGGKEGPSVPPPGSEVVIITDGTGGDVIGVIGPGGKFQPVGNGPTGAHEGTPPTYDQIPRPDENPPPTTGGKVVWVLGKIGEIVHGVWDVLQHGGGF